MMNSRSKTIQWCAVVGILFSSILALMILRSDVPTAGLPITSYNWRGASDWSFRFSRIAACSVTNPVVRGWQAEVGPLMVVRVHSVIPVPKTKAN